MSETVSLVDLINRKLEAGEVELPVFDDVALRVYRAVRKNDFDSQKICRLMEEDPALVSEALRTANSSFFSGLGQVTTLQEAMVRLGARQVANLALAASQKRLYSASKGVYRRRLDTLWKHTTAVAFGSRWLARKAGYLNLCDEAFVAGLLHDVGKVSLLIIMEALVAESAGKLQLSDHMVDVTLRQLHSSHGASLLKQWNIPDVFSEIVMKQDADQFDDSNVTLAIVRLVDRACAKEGVSDYPDPGISLDTCKEVQCLGINELVLAELLVVLEDAARQEAA